MKKSEPKALGSSANVVISSKATAMSLSELKALRQAQRATNQRVEELKMKLFRITEQHMDQAVSVIRDWMNKNKK